MFNRIRKQLRVTDSLHLRLNGRGRKRIVRISAVEERILCRAADDPGTSVRRVALMECVSTQIVKLTCHTQLLHSHHVQRSQALTPVDFLPRIHLVESVLRNYLKILFFRLSFRNW